MTTGTQLSSIIKTLGLVCLLLLPLNTAAADDLDNQILQLETALNNNPNDPATMTTLAGLYNSKAVELSEQQQWQQAEAYLSKALVLAPNTQAFNANLSSVYFKHALELYKDPTQQDYSSDSHSKARELAALAVKIDPTNVNAYLLLGDIYYMDQKMAEAQQAWQSAANLLPNNQGIQERLARLTRETQTESGMDTKYDVFFNIKIDKDIANLPGFDVALALNNARVAVSRDFLYSQPAKIPVVIYTAKDYKAALQAPEWSEGAYDGKIRLILAPKQKDFRQTKSNIVHEYTHAIIADLTKNNCPRWINEGIAKYEEYKDGVRPDIKVLAAAYNNNNLLAWNNINDQFLQSSRDQVLLAYQQSFSFVYFIVQKYGMPELVTVFKALATNPDLSAAVLQVYNIPLETLQNDWHSWLPGFIKNY